MPTAQAPASAQEFELRVTGVGAAGEGIAHGPRRAIFVPGSLPGELVRARITSAGKKLSAELLAVLEPSPERRAPPCPVYGCCGGCQLQHASYDAQLRLKAQIVLDALRSIAGQRATPASPALSVVPAPQPYAYRARGQFQVRPAAGDGPDQVQTGFFAPGSHRLCPVDQCAIHRPELNAAVAAVRTWAAARPALAGALAQIVVRCSADGAHLQVILVGLDQGELPCADLAERLGPGLAGLFVRRGGARSSTLRWGQPELHDQLLGLHLPLSADAFSQVNPAVAALLFGALRDWLADARGPLVDLYCGGGVTTLLLAAAGHEAHGIEHNHAAIADARRAAARNRLQASFTAGPAEVELPRLLARGLRPAAVVLDPPRQGADLRVLEALARARPEHVCYVSCHPGTLARDLARLQARGYRLARLQAFDMFPQTSQVECLALLRRA